MNKFVIGALAVTAVGSLAYAGGTETKEWSKFDRDFLSLTANQGSTAGSFGVNGYVRARGVRSSDVDADPATAATQEDLSGFLLDNARLEFRASQGDYGVYVALEGADHQDDATTSQDGTVRLIDAYGTVKLMEGITGQVGRFRAPFLWSSFMVEDNHQILLDRTFNSQIFQGRQDGVQIGGAYDRFSWWLAVQNGADSMLDEIMWTGRVQATALGTGPGGQEGAYGQTGELNLTIGGAYADDEGADTVGSVNSGAAWGVDAVLTQGGLSLHFELVDYEADVQPNTGLNSKTGVIDPFSLGATTGQSDTPWSATAGYMLVPNQWEIVARFEELDDTEDTTVWTVGINFYAAGHNAKWTLQGSRSDSDDAAKEADTAAIGMTVGV
jgi:hypothetical protein